MDNTEEMVTAKVRKVLHVVSEFEEGCIVYKCTITQKKQQGSLKMLDGIHWQLEEIQKNEGKFRKHKTIFVLVVLLSTMYFIFFRDGLKIYRGV